MPMQTESDYQWARPYLNADETVLWKGHPEKLHLFDRNDLFLIPFGLLWCGFAGYWEYGVLKAHAPLPFPVIGGLMMLFGLHCFSLAISSFIAHLRFFFLIIHPRQRLGK